MGIEPAGDPGLLKNVLFTILILTKDSKAHDVEAVYPVTNPNALFSQRKSWNKLLAKVIFYG
jgi:hypothetical protein